MINQILNRRVICCIALAALALVSSSLSVAQMRAVGIGVADLQASTRFYQQALGLEVQRTYELGYLNEVVMGFPGRSGAVLVLMNWPGEERRYDGSNVKLVFNVDDAAKVLVRLRDAGGTVDREAGPIDALPGTLIGFGRDLDNYVVEVIQQQ